MMRVFGALLLTFPSVMSDDLVNATSSPTIPPSTLSPTGIPAAQPIIDKTMIVAMDASFAEAYIDPFVTELGSTTERPPVVAYENGKLDSAYERGIVVPEHTNYATFDFWHGADRDHLLAFNEDIAVTVGGFNEDILKEVDIQIHRKRTTILQVRFRCNKNGQAGVKIKVLRLDTKEGMTLAFKKSCLVSSNDGLWVMTEENVVAFKQGEVEPEFNIHDLRREPFVSGVERNSEEFIFHTNGRHFQVTESPKITVFQATESVLNWIALARPDLRRSIETYKLEQSNGFLEEDDEEEEEEEEHIEDSDDDSSDEVDHDDDDSDPYEEEFAEKQFLQNLQKNMEFKLPVLDNNVVPLSTGVMKPVLSGALTNDDGRVIKPSKLKSHSGYDAGMVSHHGDKSVVIEYNCLIPGLVIVQLEFQVMPSTGTDSDKESIKINYLKVCDSGFLFNDLDGTSKLNLMGLNVHLGMYSKEDTMFFGIENGMVTAPYMITSSELVASAEASSTTFYADLDEEVFKTRTKSASEPVMLQLLSAKVDVHREHPRRTVLPQLTGNGVFGGVVFSDELPLTVWYNCQRNGVAKVTLSLKVGACKVNQELGNVTSLPEYGAKWLKMSWVKECRVTPLSHLSATTIDSQKFSNSKTALRKFVPFQVLKSGRVAKIFQRDGDRHSMYSLDPRENLLAIEVQKFTKGDGVFVFGRPVLSSSSSAVKAMIYDPEEVQDVINSNLAMMQMDEASGESRTQEMERETLTETYEVSHGNPLYWVFIHECTKPGEAVINFHIPRYASTEDGINLRWLKSCDSKDEKYYVESTAPIGLLAVLSCIVLTSCLCYRYVRRGSNQIKYLQERNRELEFEAVPLSEGSL